MPLTFAVEPVSQCWNEVMVLANAHWEGTKSYRRHEPFNPSYERYHAMNQSGFFLLFTARDGETLVGYFGIYSTLSTHSQLPMAVEDTWFLHPDYRKGRNALQFYRFVEDDLGKRGIHEVLFSSEIENPVHRILEHLGYTAVITQYSKHLQSTHVPTAQPTQHKESHHEVTQSR